MLSKIALVGCKGSGKSSVTNIFAGNDKFEVKTDIDSCTTKTDIYQNYQNGNIEIFDTQGLNYKDETDVKTFQEMIKNFKKEQLNPIFLVVNGEVCLIDEGLKTIIREICKLFMGKYIWTQIGIIITHYGYKEEQQNKVKQREGDFVKEVLDIAEKEYQEIIRNQDENNKTCDPNEKIVTNLKSFYVNAKRKENGQYDTNTLEEIEKIKQLVKDYPPINKVQSKFYFLNMINIVKALLITRYFSYRFFICKNTFIHIRSSILSLLFFYKSFINYFF